MNGIFNNSSIMAMMLGKLKGRSTQEQLHLGIMAGQVPESRSALNVVMLNNQIDTLSTTEKERDEATNKVETTGKMLKLEGAKVIVPGKYLDEASAKLKAIFGDRIEVEAPLAPSGGPGPKKRTKKES